MPSAHIPSIFSMAKARNEVKASMKRVLDAVSAGDPVDPEDLVVVRGSSEQFAEFAELYIEVRGTSEQPR